MTVKGAGNTRQEQDHKSLLTREKLNLATVEECRWNYKSGKNRRRNEGKEVFDFGSDIQLA